MLYTFVINQLFLFQSKISLYQYHNSTHTSSTLFNRAIDICHNMEKERASDFISKLFKKMNSKSYTLPSMCPIEPGVYIMKKIQIHENILPSFLKVSQYMNLTLKGKLCVKEKIKTKDEICFNQLLLRIQIFNN